LPTYWLKKTLLDKKYYAQRLLHFMQLLNFDLFGLIFDYHEKTFSKRLLNRLKRLRMRYSKPGKPWFGKEELSVLLFYINYISKGYNNLGIVIFSKFF